MVGLCPAGVLVLAAQVLETIVRVESVREEDLVIHEDVRVFLLCGVQRLHVPFDDGLCALGGRYDKIMIDLQDGSISLATLCDSLFREVLHDLVLFVPVAHTLWIESIQRHHSLVEFCLG